jgi:glycosyltransferase involved in cell wall biosynthesis
MVPALAAARAQARQRFGVPEDAIVVAHVARYHRDKDQANLLNAFDRALSRVPQLHLMLVGRGLGTANKQLNGIVESYGIQRSVSQIGELDSTLEAFQAAEIFCLSSLTEAFPVSLVEALQCGLVPVVTDVGECRTIAQDVGFVVPPNSPQELAEALVDAARTAEPSRQVRLS